MRTRLLALVLTTVVTAFALVGPASAADPITPGTPTISGTAQYEKTLTVDPGSWPDGYTFSYQWLRDGRTSGSDSPANTTYTISNTYDIDKRISVRVTATGPDGAQPPVTSAATAKVVRATVALTKRPVIKGTAKFRQKLTASSGRWSRKVDFHYRWLRDDKPITSATSRSYVLAPSDVGHKIRFRVTVTRKGFETAVARSAATATVKHLRSVRKVVTYSVATRGSISSSLSTFKKLAQQTYDDPRGWRSMGIQFKRVSSGGDFTLVLSQASKVPSFSSGCSSTYSCRVGRYVIINQTRWAHASPAWNDHGGSLRNYRNLVVNHETGHWLGKQHAGCGGKGQLAPVMMQQSKGLSGCKINLWPKTSELHSPRFGY